MNSSQIYPDCKISAPIPGLACATVAISHIAFWVKKSTFRVIVHARLQIARTRLRQSRFAREEFGIGLARAREMRLFTIDNDLAGTRPGIVIGAHRERVGTRRTHREEIARREREIAVVRQEI